MSKVPSPTVQKLLAQRVLARRRLLQFTKMTHPSYEAGWVHDDICRRLERFSRQVAEKQSPRLMLLMPPRHGKLLADDTLVFTRADGWKTHGTLAVGDEVMGLKGWVTVIGVSAPGWASLEVRTTAGTRIQCHPHHEWALEEYCARGVPDGKRKRYVMTTFETKDLLAYRERKGDMWSGGSPTMRRFYFPEIDWASFGRHPGLYDALKQKRMAPHCARLAVDDVTVMDEPVEGRCIQVSATDGVYLVTRDFVPTHNSELASIRFPAWHLGEYPEHELINVGYNLDLPMKFSRKVRDVMREASYRAIFPDARLDPESQSVEAWNMTRGGGFTAAGVGGGITGKGAHILIIDDPIKNQEEADSVATRDKLWDWYQSTAYTRLAPGGGVLVIETWWNDDDLAGRLQAMMAAGDPDNPADQFEIVRYPALSTEWEYRDNALEHQPIIRSPTPIDIDNPPLGMSRELELLRPIDFCLHEARYPTDALKRIKANMQPRIWSALYQQNPVPDEGMYFKKDFFRYEPTSPVPNGMSIFTAWDFAIGEKQQNDWTVGATILQDENDVLHVLEIFRMKGDSFLIIEAVLDVAKRWGEIPGTGYIVGVEDGQIWRALEPMFKKRMTERRQYPPYEILRPLTDKMARARPLQGRMQQGRVIFPEGASWLPQAEQELLRFPAGAHDDVVDALAWVVHLCLNKAPPRVEVPPELKSWRDKLNFIGSTSGTHLSA